MAKYYENRYAAMEETEYGWVVVNLVTGIPVGCENDEMIPRHYATYKDARGKMIELWQHYHAIEFSRF